MLHLLEWDLQLNKVHLFKELLQQDPSYQKALRLNKEKFGLDRPQNIWEISHQMNYKFLENINKNY